MKQQEGMSKVEHSKLVQVVPESKPLHEHDINRYIKSYFQQEKHAHITPERVENNSAKLAPRMTTKVSPGFESDENRYPWGEDRGKSNICKILERLKARKRPRKIASGFDVKDFRRVFHDGWWENYGSKAEKPCL